MRSRISEAKARVFLIAMAIVAAYTGWATQPSESQVTPSRPSDRVVPALPQLPAGMPPLTPEQLAEMERREQIEDRMSVTPPNQQVDARLLDPLSDSAVRAIVVELDKLDTGAGGVLPTGRNRQRLELAWYSGRLARDGVYPSESRIPEGKAVQTILRYRPTAGPTESWPPHFLPGLSPSLDHGTGRNPIPILYEMRVDAQADGSMVFAFLASMGDQKVLLSGIKVKSGEIASMEVPGGHRIAIHATLRDQTSHEKQAVQLMATALSQGPQAIEASRLELYPVFYGGPPGSAATTDLGVPPAVIEQMRTTRRNEAFVRALGARP